MKFARGTIGGKCGGRRVKVRQHGYSVIEVLAVVAIIAIMIAIALPTIVAGRRIYAVDDASNQIVDILQFAQQRALAERQTMRVELVPGTDSTRGTIQVIDQETLGAGAADDVVIRNEVLPENRDVTVNTSVSLLPAPPTPFNFQHWTWPGGNLVIRFRPDGTVTNEMNIPQSLTLTMYVPISSGVPDLGLTRAVTLFGPTGTCRSWSYNQATSKFEEV